MTDDLLGYYNRELSLIRREASRFAQTHPKVAARLRLGTDGSEDPHVERLLEGFAFLTAGVRQRLDDGYAEMAEALLGVLYPHYLAPIPSAAIVQFHLDVGQNELAAGLTFPRGKAIETEPIQGEPCRFRTAYPVAVWPIDVKLAALQSAPFSAPVTARSNTAAAVLRLQLTCRSPNLTFAKLTARKLRIYLHGQNQHANRLYEMLLNQATDLAFATGVDDRTPVVVKASDVIHTVGFETDEGLIPYPDRSFLGYRLLTELFTFPRKFLFIDVDLPPAAMARIGNRLELFVYLARSATDLEPNVSAEMFRLGCTPVVNLHARQAEPIRLTQTDPEYRVIPDVRRPLAHEVYSVDRVAATTADGEEIELRPLFGARQGLPDRTSTVFWSAARRPASVGSAASPDAPVDRGTEIYLTFVDATNKPLPPSDWTVHVQVTTLNRDLPARLPFGGGQPRLQLATGGAAVRLECLTPPTNTVRPRLGPESIWRLVSHLNLNHLSISGGATGAAALRELLALYDVSDVAETKAMIEGLVGVDTKRITAWAGGALCRGVEVAVTFDEPRYTGYGLFVFASVLDRFFGLYASLNSFTRTVAKLAQREGIYKQWPPRIADRPLI